MPRALRILLVLLVLVGLAEVVRVLIGDNFHTVLQGRVYRCAQQSDAGLSRLTRRHGIRTVVNLRGGNVDLAWYRAEGRTTHNLDIAQEDICLSAGRLPPAHEIRRLIDVLDRTEYPILVHCRRGSDRTGLASAIILLLQGEATLDEAQAQLGLRYGHLNLGRTAHLDEFFEQYRAWLEAEQREHTPDQFRHWARTYYLPGGYACRIEPLELPEGMSRGKAVPLKVRVHNTGHAVWQLRPENNAGVHVGYVVQDMDGKALANGRSGLFLAQVPPGKSIDLTLILPEWVASGHRYRILVDMVEEQQFWFFQAGSEPWEWEFQARDNAGTAPREPGTAGLVGLAH